MSAAAHGLAMVGPVLRSGATSAALAAVLRADNPSTEVVDRGGYLRVQAPGRLVLRCENVEAKLGREFRLPGDLEMLMPAFAGRLVISERQAEWSAE